MKKISSAICATILFWACPAFSENSEEIVSLSDPKAFFRVLDQMGFETSEMLLDHDFPSIIITNNDEKTSVVLGGCIKRKNCTHIFLSSSFTDIINPPYEWMDKINTEFDFLKVTRSKNNELFFSEAHAIDGTTRTHVRKIFDFWNADAAELAIEALKIDDKKK